VSARLLLIPYACGEVSVRTNSGKCPILNSSPYSFRATLVGEVGNDNIEQNRLDAIGTLGDLMIKLMKSSDGASGVKSAVTVETVADILEREIDTLIEEWLTRVEKAPDLMSIQMNREDRTGHLPHLIHDVIKRLRLDAAMKAPVSKAAAEHGDLRRKQGYTVAMMVEESRLLQISIFTTLHNNVTQLEFDALLPDVVTIADEVDAQLKEQMLRFMAADAAEKAKAK
jgi:RsbRD-like negative regulator of sigma factor